MRLQFFRAGLTLLLLIVAQTAFAQGSRISAFGTGCSSATIGYTGIPDTGDTFTITLSGAPSNAPVVLFVGFSNTSFGGNNLPLDVTALGAPGCFLNVSPDISLNAFTNSQGEASVSIPIPNGTGYDGIQFYAQWMIVQPGANALGLVATSALQAVVRNPVVIKDTIGGNSSYTDGKYGMHSTYVPSSGALAVAPAVAQVSSPSFLKSLRVIGYKYTSTSMSCLDYRLRVWTSLGAAIASPLQGDVADILYLDPTVGPSAFGVGPTQSADGISYQMKFDAPLGNVQLQPNVPYAFALVAIRNGSCAWWKNSESNVILGPSDTFIMNSSTALASTFPGMTTGVYAMEVITSLAQ